MKGDMTPERDVRVMTPEYAAVYEKRMEDARAYLTRTGNEDLFDILGIQREESEAEAETE